MFIGFDGSTEKGPPRSRVEVEALREHGFISQIRNKLTARGELTEYWDGPHLNGYGVRGIVAQGIDFVCTNANRAMREGLVIGGYSRGGLIALHVAAVVEKLSVHAAGIVNDNAQRRFRLSVLARTVQRFRDRAHKVRNQWGGVEAGFTPVGPLPELGLEYFDLLGRIRIDGLLLLDPVGMTPRASDNPKVNTNTPHLHFKRSKAGLSRYFFRNIEFGNSYHSISGTHSAIGGLPCSSIGSHVPWTKRDWCLISTRQDHIAATQVAGTIETWFQRDLNRSIAPRVTYLPPLK